MYSVEKKIIFTHPPKCGGGTIHMLLKQFCKNDDAKGHVHRSLLSYEREFNDRGLDFEGFFKISCTRNPYDRMVSRFFHDKFLQKDNILTVKGADSTAYKGFIKYYGEMIDQNFNFDAYVKLRYDLLTRCASEGKLSSGWCGNPVGIRKFMFLRGKYIIDYIIKYESFEKDIKVLFSEFGIEIDEIPIINATPRTPNKPYQEFYENQESVDLVTKMAKHSIEMYGYSF